MWSNLWSHILRGCVFIEWEPDPLEMGWEGKRRESETHVDSVVRARSPEKQWKMRIRDWASG